MFNLEITCRVEELIPKLFSLNRDTIYDIKIQEHKEKRSLNANSYCWKLIGQIADRMRMSKTDCYIKMLRDYGQSDVVTVSSAVPVDRYFKYYEKESQNGVYSVYRVYRGSSTYNTYEMSVLIDGVVQEAKNLDIETLTPEQISVLKDTYGEGN